MTPREVAVVVKGARWRHDQAAKLTITGAWMTARLTRAKKMPKLSSLLKDPSALRIRQSPEQQRSVLLDVAEHLGLKVERHEKPVV